jgi:hypothetical protein
MEQFRKTAPFPAALSSCPEAQPYWREGRRCSSSLVYRASKPIHCLTSTAAVARAPSAPTRAPSPWERMPSLHNFNEMAACAPDLVGVNFLPGGQLYSDESGPRWPIYYSLPLCGMRIDGRFYDSTSCQWFAYQAVRRAQVGDLDVVTTNRLVIEDTVVLWRVKFTNHGATPKTFDVALTADIGWKPVNREIIGPGEIRATSDKWKMDSVYRFFDLLQNKANGQFAEWQVSVAPGESREIRFLMHVEEPGKPGRSGLTSEWFETQWDRTKAEWESRWNSAFTPGNNFFSGNAPLLVTDDAAIREIYSRCWCCCELTCGAIEPLSRAASAPKGWSSTGTPPCSLLFSRCSNLSG